MVLNYIWIAFFLLAALCAIIQCFIGNTGVFADIVGSTFENAKTAFEISIGLTGVLSLWMGIMKDKGASRDEVKKYLERYPVDEEVDVCLRAVFSKKD